MARSIFAFLAAALALLPAGFARADGALCGGTTFPLSSSLGPTPHIDIAVDGVRKSFLVDYGATQGTLWTNAQSAGAATRRASLDLPGVAAADFLVRTDPQASDAPAGILGTDVLSRLTVQLDADRAWISAGACDPGVLAAAGYRAIDQTGFFSTDRKETDASRPNVPVLFLRLGETQAFAQIDTGYADATESHSIDINQAMFEALGGAAALSAAGATVVVTCEGVETRPIYRAAQSLDVMDRNGTRLAIVGAYQLILKRTDKCGGIAGTTEPAAQVGISFLRTLGPIIFDPRARRVWVRAQP